MMLLSRYVPSYSNFTPFTRGKRFKHYLKRSGPIFVWARTPRGAVFGPVYSDELSFDLMTFTNMAVVWIILIIVIIIVFTVPKFQR